MSSLGKTGLLITLLASVTKAIKHGCGLAQLRVSEGPVHNRVKSNAVSAVKKREDDAGVSLPSSLTSMAVPLPLSLPLPSPISFSF